MTDILTTDQAIAARPRVAQPGHRANKFLAIALAATVALTAAVVAATLTNNDSPVTAERAVEAGQLRWEGLAAAQTVAPAAHAASQLRWEGIAQAITSQTTASHTANQLRWEGLAASAARLPTAQIASQLRWEALAAADNELRQIDAQRARWEALAEMHGAG